MQIQFKTISIGSLVLSYLGTMAVFILLLFVFDIEVLAVLLLIFPVVLYFMFSGEVCLKTVGDKLLVSWIKKPLLKPEKDLSINLNEVIRWKHQVNGRGPESFTIILEDGKQLEFRPAMFSTRNWHSELWKAFDNKMREFHSNTSEESLYNQIKHSGYIKKLNHTIRNVRYLNYSLIIFGLLSLILMIILPDFETALSIVFLGAFVLLLGFVIYGHHLKLERNETLRRK